VSDLALDFDCRISTLGGGGREVWVSAYLVDSRKMVICSSSVAVRIESL